MLLITVYPQGFPIPVSDYTIAAYNVVDKIKPRDIILFDISWAPAAEPYFETGFIALFKHIASKGGRICAMSTAADGPMMFDRAIVKLKPKENWNYEYGRDYIHIGYIPGYDSAYSSILADVTKVVSKDYHNTPLSELDMIKDLQEPTYEHIVLVIHITGDMHTMEGWIRQCNRYHVPNICYTYEVIMPQAITYYPTNTIGIINGGTGAAEYEVYSGFPGEAAVLSDYQTVGNGIILIFLILGTIGFLYSRFRRGLKE